jgi:phosphohistidine swiveling domain-containing protein
MKIEKIRRELSKIDWYQQGSASKPLYTSYPLYSCSLMKQFGKKIPVRYEIVLYTKRDYMDDYISKRSLEKVARYYFEKQHKDKKFLSRLMNYWNKKFVGPYLKMNREMLNEDLKKYSGGDLKIAFEKFSNHYLDVWHESIFLDSFDFFGEKLLQELITEKKLRMEEKDLDILLAPPGISFLQRERLELLSLAEKIGKREIVKNNIDKNLDRISQQFYWLKNDYSQMHFLGPEYFSKKIDELLNDKRKLIAEKEARRELKSLKNKKKKIIIKYGLLRDTMDKINFFSVLGNFRDARKSYNQMAGNMVRKFAEEFSRRFRVKVEMIEYMFFWEIARLFEKDKKIVSSIKSRRGGWFYLMNSPDRFTAAKGKQAGKLNDCLKEIFSEKVELKGMPAYAGIVEGKANIIKDQKDFHKMKKGDILVAPNTRPEYIQVMKKAAAIITDEGGITCHAAIISRELKIPAIVGVQGATSILRDGEKIKVDSISGVIERLK